MDNNRPAPVITFPYEVQDPYVSNEIASPGIPVQEIFIPTPTISNQNITIPQAVSIQDTISQDTILGPVTSVETSTSIPTTPATTPTILGSTILANTIAPIKPVLASMGISGGGGSTPKATQTAPALTPTPTPAKKDYTMYYIGVPIVLLGLLIGYKTLKK